MSEATAVVLFDGVCSFCNSSVQFIIRRDPKACFKFASLQSEVGGRLAAEHGIDASKVASVVLIQDGQAFVKSAAALRVARGLRWPWPVLSAFLIIPRVIRDWFYDRFAERRYRWFGKLEACPIPSEKDRSRFLS